MRIRQWGGKGAWLFAVAMATSTLSPPRVAGWGGDPLPLSSPSAEGDQLVSAPKPSEPPAAEPSGGSRPGREIVSLEPPSPGTAPTAAIFRLPDLAPPSDILGEPLAPVEDPAPEPPLILDEAIFEDVRADAVVILTPGIPVPIYPIVVNNTVESLIDHFTARERERFGLWLARSGRYLGMIRRILRERGLPEELAYTAMIESGFSPRAVSRVGAKGLWQFMEGTARRYGLVVNRWVDERLDPVKSTGAAAQYLGDLYGMFGHWFLAQAAYNAGEARVARAIHRAKTTDFWALTQTRHLPVETKLFVPQILAATVITRAPSRYGFEVTMAPPLDYDEVAVKRPLDLETVATLAGVSVDDVRELNPALRAGITPPFGTYALRLPVGVGARFETALQSAPVSSLTSWVVHRVDRNQSLAQIARLYRVSPQRLAEVNQLRGGRLRGVTELIVPVAAKVAAKSAPSERAMGREPSRSTSAPADKAGSREVVVRRGETLWGIAARLRVEPQALARLNGRDLDDPLYPGDRLKIQIP